MIVFMYVMQKKQIHRDSKSEVARCWEKVEGAVTANEYRVSLGRWWKGTEIREWWWGFLGGASGKRSCLPVQGDAGGTALIPSKEDALEEGMATHCSILAWRIPMDGGARWATVHEVTKSQTCQKHSDYTMLWINEKIRKCTLWNGEFYLMWI